MAKALFLFIVSVILLMSSGTVTASCDVSQLDEVTYAFCLGGGDGSLNDPLTLMVDNNKQHNLPADKFHDLPKEFKETHIDAVFSDDVYLYRDSIQHVRVSPGSISSGFQDRICGDGKSLNLIEMDIKKDSGDTIGQTGGAAFAYCSIIGQAITITAIAIKTSPVDAVSLSPDIRFIPKGTSVDISVVEWAEGGGSVI
jgi:hypothetical protein